MLQGPCPSTDDERSAFNLGIFNRLQLPYTWQIVLDIFPTPILTVDVLKVICCSIVHIRSMMKTMLAASKIVRHTDMV